MRIFEQDQTATLDYLVDWSKWLSASEVIVSSEWTIDPGAELAIAQFSVNSAGSKTIVWLSGGEVGQIYAIANKIVTDQGRTDRRSFYVRVIPQFIKENL